MTALVKIGDVLGELEAARESTPAEVTANPDGTAGVVRWVGTPPSSDWLTKYINSLVAAGLVKEFTAHDDPAVRAQNVERLEAWRRAIGGLPVEGLIAARQHFERGGEIPGDRWFLRPADISGWVRRRAERDRGQLACPDHPDEWRHSCFPCADKRRSEAASVETIRRIREQLRKELGK